VIVGGMLIGPIMMLVVVPALQTLFLARGSARLLSLQGDEEPTADALKD
jgi:hypothetical protein